MGQTRERPSNKAERRKAAEASRAPIVRCKSSVAGTSVFAIEDLTRLIFLQTPEGVLLSKFQRVCRQWQKLAQEVLQPFLDGMPTSSPKMKFQDRQMNPLLREHFGRIFDDGKMQLNIGLWLTGQHFSRMRSLIDLPMATSGPGRVVHEAYARAGASWRNMQIYHPPIYEIKYRREGEDALEITETARGIRFGDVYDVLVAITSNTKGFSWSEALLNWPQIGPDDDTESRSNDDDSDDEPASRDCIYIERRQHDLPKFCECARAPSDNERCFCGFGGNKHKLQLIASNKWRVTSKEYNEKDLIVCV